MANIGMSCNNIYNLVLSRYPKEFRVFSFRTFHPIAKPLEQTPYLHLEDVMRYVTTSKRFASSQESPSGKRSNCSTSVIHLLYWGLNRRSRRTGQDPMWFSKARSKFRPNWAG